MTQIPAALFVDFDNIFINLDRLDNNIAMRFATNPAKWLTWLEQELPIICPVSEPSQRRILIRRCYLNPQTFGPYRPYFIRSAFEVIDCPPLTKRDKTSTDIHMVMDILDAMNHITHFKEFIILSGDADFTPVLLRLRMYDRYTAVLSSGYASPAYKAACDHLISEDAFIRDAMGISLQEEETSPQISETGEASQALLSQMAKRLYESAVLPEGIVASELPAVYIEFPEFRQSDHWLGFFSLRNLTEAIVSQRDDLCITEEDPWRVARAVPIHEAPQIPSGGTATYSEETLSEIQRAIAEWIREIVRSSQRAVPMASLAQGVTERFGEYVSNNDWLGAGSFKNMLAQLELGDLKVHSTTPGYVYDPAKHESPGMVPASDQVQFSDSLAAQPIDTFVVKYPDLASIARQIHHLTDTPYLLPEHYALLLQELAREVNENGFQLTRTSKTVRDRCVERGAPIARSHVNFVLIGIGYTGHRFGEQPESAEQLGEALIQNVKNLCRTAQMELTKETETKIQQWITGALSI